MRKHSSILIITLLLAAVLMGCRTTPTTAPATAVPTAKVTEAPTGKASENAILLDKNITYYSSGSNWADIAYSLGEGHTGNLKYKFNLTPLTNSATLYLAFADSSADVQRLTDNAIIIRFNGTAVDAVNGKKFESNQEMQYKAEKTISMSLEINTENSTYTLYASTPGNEPILIARDFAFNPLALSTDDIGKVFFISDEEEQFSIEGLGSVQKHKPSNIYYSTAEGNDWQSSGMMLGSSYSDLVKIEFDMYAEQDNIDGSVDFTDTDFTVAEYGDLAILIRMCSSGFFDVRNGNQGQMAIAQVPYTGGEFYHIEIHADTNSKTYDVYVTSPSGEKTKIAENFGFRATANHADDIGQLFMYSSQKDKEVTLTNLWIAEVKSFEDVIAKPSQPGNNSPVQTAATKPTTASVSTSSGSSPGSGTSAASGTSIGGSGYSKGEYWLVPDANIYRINGTNYLAYYPTLEKSAIKNNIKARANQINLVAERHPDARVYAYYITKTEDLNWFDESEGIKAFDYASYMNSLLSDEIGCDKLKINNFDDLKKLNYMTDHHWNHNGVQQGYEDTMAMLSKDFELSPVKKPLGEVDFKKELYWYGSKYRKSGGIKNVDPDEFRAYKYELGEYVTYVNGVKTAIANTKTYESGYASSGFMTDHYTNYYGDHTDIVKYEFDGNKYNCLMIGDSNCFPIRKLIASHFSSFYYIDKYVLSNYRIDEFIEQNNIDAVIFMGQLDLFENMNYKLQDYPAE